VGIEVCVEIKALGNAIAVEINQIRAHLPPESPAVVLWCARSNDVMRQSCDEWLIRVSAKLTALIERRNHVEVCILRLIMTLQHVRAPVRVDIEQPIRVPPISGIDRAGTREVAGVAVVPR